MNRNTVFKFEFFSDQNDESINDEYDNRILNSKLNFNQIDQLDTVFNKNCLNEHFSQNLNYQLDRQINSQINCQQSTNKFNQELNHRLNQHLISINKRPNQKFINKIKSTVSKRNLVDQNKFYKFFINLLNYYENLFFKLNLNLIYFINCIVYWIKFFLIDLFHHFIFRFLFTNKQKRRFLFNWLKKVTYRSNDQNDLSENDLNDDIIYHNTIQGQLDNLSKDLEVVSFVDLFSNGKLLCGLVNVLNFNACSRYDLLDIHDADTNLELAYRLILTHYHLDEKINLFYLDSNESELRLIDLISKIQYLEAKKELFSIYQYGHSKNYTNTSIVSINALKVLIEII